MLPLVETLPEETGLLANYPNPLNPETWMLYQLLAPIILTIIGLSQLNSLGI